MAIPEKNKKYTPEEYLALERKAQTKSEYYKGEIFAMSGASRNHNVITINLITQLKILLKGKGCRPYGSDMRMHIPFNSLYTYPDVMVVYGEEQYVDNQFDTLTSPSFIAEVLSPSTTDYDIGGKFALYRSIESLKEYWTISSYDYRVTKYVKNDSNGTWILSETNNPNDILELTTLSLQVPLSEVYADVKF